MPERPPKLPDMLDGIKGLPREAIPALLAALAGRLAEADSAPSTSPPSTPEPTPAGDKLLTAEQVALALGLDVEAVARRRFPFARRIGHRTVRYSEAGLRKWMRNGSP